MQRNDDLSPPRSPNFLQRQLERARFERALEVADSMVEKGAFLNSAELARINNILLGREAGEAWREEAAVLKLPSGRVEKLQLMADPVNKTREILRGAQERAKCGEVIDAAADVYAQLVLTHPFKDANRRSGVVAAAYLLKLHGVEVSAMGLHELGLGDLRAPGQLQALRDLLRDAVKLGAGDGQTPG